MLLQFIINKSAKYSSQHTQAVIVILIHAVYTLLDLKS